MAARVHGDSHNGSGIYLLWKRIKQRCYYSGNCNYRYYGGKGIRMCSDWLDYTKFKEWATCNGWSDGLTIDRLDTDDDYGPLNCRFVTLSENVSRNNTERAEKKKRAMELA